MKNAASAASKLPDLGPGGFRITANSITTAKDDSGKRRFRTVASSTITDRVGNTITLNALQQLRDAYRAGRTVFMDHDYENVVDNVFGMSDTAEIVQTPEHDPRTGQPIYDLIVEGLVNEPNQRAVQLSDSIDGGYAKFGASIGAIIRSRRKDKETGGWIIDGISGEELSIVGMPKNQRSWAYKAALAAEDMEVDEAEDEGEEKVIDTPAVQVSTLATSGTTTTTITQFSDNTTPNFKLGVANPDDLGEGASPETPADPAPEPEKGDEADKEATPGGQEADAATPETAPEAEKDEADPAVEQKAADDFEAGDVVALVQHVETLVAAIGERDEQIAALTAQIKQMEVQQGQLAQAQEDATKTIQQVMSMPLQRRAVGHITEHVEKFSGVYDPRVLEYIARTTKENA